MILVVKQKNEVENFFIMVDMTRYDCEPITGFSDRYYCPGFPFRVNEYIVIEVFSPGIPYPLARGKIFLDSNWIKPPNPYKP
jgi:hypothetical protein